MRCRVMLSSLRRSSSVRRVDHLVERRDLRSVVLGFRGELAVDRGDELIMLAFALAYHLGRVAIALLRVRLVEMRDDLTLGDAVSDRDVERSEPAAGRRNRVDHPAALADQNSLSGNPGRNAADESPDGHRDEAGPQNGHGDPIARTSDPDQMVQMLRRGEPLDRGRGQTSSGGIAHGGRRPDAGGAAAQAAP